MHTLEIFHLTLESLKTLREMAEQLPGGFVLYQENENRDILFVNTPLLRIYGCDTLDEFRALTGFAFHGMVHPEDFSRVQDSITAQISGQHDSSDHVIYRILTRDGDVRWVDDYGRFAYSEDFGDIFYVFLFDITEMKKAQDAEKSFFFHMSHECLTPMNAVTSFIRLAMAHRDDPVLLTQYLRSAEEAAGRLSGLMEDLIGIDRMEEDASSDTLRAPNLSHIRILIAEDNEINQMLLQTILEEEGFIVEAVDDGSEAVEAVRSHETGYYSIILMDIQMKTMNGYEACRLIRALPGCGIKELPILALSANAREEDRLCSGESGMNGHLAKPYHPEQIFTEVLRHCRHTDHL